MTDAIPQQTVVGKVTYLGCSGIGPNSGEITLVIQASNGQTAEVFVGIPFGPGGYGVESAVFSAYMSMALAALSGGHEVEVNFLQADKARINGMVLRP